MVKQSPKERSSKRQKISRKTESDGFTGRYQSFSRMVKDEGGDAAAFAAVCNYVTCAALFAKRKLSFRGKPWAKWHSMKKQVEWLVIEEEFRGDVSTLWEQVASEEASVPASSSGLPLPASSPTPAPSTPPPCQNPAPSTAAAEEQGGKAEPVKVELPGTGRHSINPL